jgi:hypothetical protein
MPDVDISDNTLEQKGIYPFLHCAISYNEGIFIQIEEGRECYSLHLHRHLRIGTAD